MTSMRYSLCGRGERSVPAFVEPTCRQCGPLRARIRYITGGRFSDVTLWRLK